jgi:hypothetical protein
MAWSPQGDLIATGSNDKTVKLMRYNHEQKQLEGREVMILNLSSCGSNPTKICKPISLLPIFYVSSSEKFQFPNRNNFLNF